MNAPVKSVLGSVQSLAPSPGHAACSDTFITVNAAARDLGLHVWKLRRAVKLGLVPSYTLLNARRFVILSEVRDAIKASRMGGAT